MTTSLTASRRRYAQAAALAVATVLFLLFGIGALGIVGDGDRDMLYLAAPVVALVGAVVARFRAHGMAAALAAAAVTTLVAGAVAVVLVVRADETASLLDIAGLSSMYALLFGASAWLFRRSDRLA